jgi:uncharacterized protein (UPF0332 family)
VKEITRALLDKAERAIAAAEKLVTTDAESVVNRAYYAMFYVSEALLAERGLRFSKHSGVHSAFGSEFAKSGVLDTKYHRWLITAFNKRIAADYGVEVEITADDACALVEQAKEFASAARTLPCFTIMTDVCDLMVDV